LEVLTFVSGQDVIAAQGREIGPSHWLLIDQARIDAFARATNDHQWIHVDPVRALAGPFGTTIAHGFLSLSLVAPILGQLLRFENLAMSLNYGCEKVRFPSPVPVGSQVRGRGVVVRAERISESPDTVQAVIRVAVELASHPKPACVAESVSRWYFDPAVRGSGGIAGTAGT
jgi:acyl dehydratase